MPRVNSRGKTQRPALPYVARVDLGHLHVRLKQGARRLSEGSSGNHDRRGSEASGSRFSTSPPRDSNASPPEGSRPAGICLRSASKKEHKRLAVDFIGGVCEYI